MVSGPVGEAMQAARGRLSRLYRCLPAVLALRARVAVGNYSVEDRLPRTLVILPGMLGKQEVASMGLRIVMASKFKEQCLALLDEVARTKVSIVVTKSGRPVARVAPVEESAMRPTMGSVRLVATEDAAYFSTGEAWHAVARS